MIPTVNQMQTLGELLRAVREEKGLSIEELAASTKIMKTQLRGLENDDFKSIPAPVYAKSFIKTISSRLGVDPAPMLAQYAEQTGGRPVVSVEVPAPKAPKRPRGSLFGGDTKEARKEPRAARTATPETGTEPAEPPPPRGPSLAARARAKMQSVSVPKGVVPGWMKKKPSFTWIKSIRFTWLSRLFSIPWVRPLALGLLGLIIVFFLLRAIISSAGNASASHSADGSPLPENLVDNPVIRDPDLPYLQPGNVP